MHLGLLSGSGPVSAPFQQNSWSGWFSESTQSSSVGSRTEKVLASILELSSGVFVGPCRKMPSLHPKDFQALVARHPERAPVDGVFGVASVFSVSLGCLK